METYLTRPEWLKLNGEQRLKIRQLFNIPIEEDASVFGNNIVSDGVKVDTLKLKLNVDTMATFLNTTGTKEELWNTLLDSIVEKPVQPLGFGDSPNVFVIPTGQPITIMAQAKPSSNFSFAPPLKKTGKPKKNG